jgi:hypothetical protein
MKNGQMQMGLIPEHGGAYTKVQLSGSVPTAIPQRTVTRLTKGLAFWSGWPVLCVLSVDMKAASWCEWWTEKLADIAAHHLEVRYEARSPQTGGKGR